MSSERPEPLRVLIANERRDRLEAATAVVEKLGYVVVARELAIADVAGTTARVRPDVALVAVGDELGSCVGL